ncbi:hypothetical protein ARMGADRAFT_1038244 [Armillaria gallica]|uniref:Uncharacterized protein n=1 Tax=Armillaria gallica TaxID=47427 RepID=A0A2H3CNJ1_ARMGA|nr:hypothetical protein ARMGADRAFT_1038244 [Armillaria gallica]
MRTELRLLLRLLCQGCFHFAWLPASDGYKQARRTNTYFNPQGTVSFSRRKIVMLYATTSAMDVAFNPSQSKGLTFAILASEYTLGRERSKRRRESGMQTGIMASDFTARKSHFNMVSAKSPSGRMVIGYKEVMNVWRNRTFKTTMIDVHQRPCNGSGGEMRAFKGS